MWRELAYFLELAAVCTLLRFLILLIWEQKQRFTFRRQFGKNAETTVEMHVASWRKKTGRWLWFNLVGIPLVTFFIILYVGSLQ